MTLTIYAVGDIMLGDHPICLGHGVGSKIKKKGAEYIFKHVASRLSEGDIIFGNLEAVLSNKNLKVGDPYSVMLRGEPMSVKGLKCAGFNVLSLANNHMMQHGMEALTETMELLSTNNIRHVPTTATDGFNDFQEPLILKIKKVKIAFIAYCLIRDPTGFCISGDYNKIIGSIKRAKKQCDLLVLSLHWGYEYIEVPSPEQIRLAHTCVDAGADIILGHHPHILQGIEEYNGKIIAYSLGNFVFDMWQEKMREGMILELRINNEKIKCISHPVLVNTEYQPELVQGKEKIKARRKMDGLSKVIKSCNTISVDETHYLKLAEQATENYRRDIRLYVLKNLYKYSTKTFIFFINEELKNFWRNKNNE